jgi:phosphorylcholine metabolism protein LicD
MYSKRKTTYVIASGGSYGYKKEIIPLKWVEKQSVVLFRDVEFCCPVLFHEYLVNLYGDYMTPPSPEQRHNRHGIKLIKYAEM